MYVYFEDGPLKGQIKSLAEGMTQLRAMPPIEPMTEAFSDANAKIPKNATITYVVYEIVAVVGHPSGCGHKAAVS